MRPARSYIGGTCRIACKVASVIAGNEPTMATNTTARSVTPNQITASGTHATNGGDLQGHDEGRIAASCHHVEREAEAERDPEHDRDREGEEPNRRS